MTLKTVYAVDFDGTLCQDKFPNIGAANDKLIAFLIKRRSKGDKVILWTCRENERLREALTWCHAHGLEFDAVNDNLDEANERYGNNCRKVFADIYIDDKNASNSKFGLPFGA